MTFSSNEKSQLRIYIIIGVFAFLLVAAIVLVLVILSLKKKKIRVSNQQADRKVKEAAREVSSAFGGKENIEKITQQGSRVTVRLKDPSLADKDKINLQFKDAMYRGNKIIFVVGSMSEEFKKLLEENRK